MPGSSPTLKGINITTRLRKPPVKNRAGSEAKGR